MKNIKHFKQGDILPVRTLKAVTGAGIDIPDPQALVHLQFRRFSDCPICHTHLGKMMRRAHDIKAAGIREVIFFHSPAKDLLPFHKEIPFELVADPKKEYYEAFGVESSLRFFSLSALWAGLRGMTRGKFGLKPTGGPMGLPADFLIAPSGRIIAAKYGNHAYDQWSADELLALAKDVAVPSEEK